MKYQCTESRASDALVTISLRTNVCSLAASVNFWEPSTVHMITHSCFCFVQDCHILHQREES